MHANKNIHGYVSTDRCSPKPRAPALEERTRQKNFSSTKTRNPAVNLMAEFHDDIGQGNNTQARRFGVR